LLRQAGGLERLKLECLSDPVVVEIQAIIKSHIEKTWLPLFLSTAEFTERLTNQPKPQTVGRPSQAVYREARRRKGAWEAGGLWMSSSKEILPFRTDPPPPRHLYAVPALCISEGRLPRKRCALLARGAEIQGPLSLPQ
ncbi:regulator of G-protein signaling 22-like, partial [Notothenia coriiceps]|uniref:Regulator of G-protein signaling 22-like n=1 Tax=Notothenia coriiceps TaxID=8208 RepID=A0A6I9NTK9_9TELE